MESLKRVILPIVLLALFAVYQANIIMNTHIHYVNGVTFTHSHPNNGEHTHSNSEILLLNRLSVFHSLELKNSDYNSYTEAFFYIIELEDLTSLSTGPYDENSPLRAPPFFS